MLINFIASTVEIEVVEYNLHDLIMRNTCSLHNVEKICNVPISKFWKFL